MSRAQLNSVLRSASRQSFTATAGQVLFAITSGYIAGNIDVYANGAKLVSGSDYSATDGRNITLVSARAENDAIDVVVGVTAMGGIGQVSRQSFVATASQTVFTIAGDYQPNAIDVFKNGVKLQNGVDVTVTSGSTITIATPCIVNDIVDVSANQVTGLTGVTNLSTTQDSTTVSVLSDTGSDIVIPAATTSNAGVMTAADKVTLVTLRNYGMKNRIINGGMSVWQRGTSVSSGVVASTYLADRWFGYATGAAVTLSQSGGDDDFQYCLAAVGAAGNTNIDISQKIESANIYCAAGTQFTLRLRYYRTSAITPGFAIFSANTVDNFTAKTVVVAGSFSAVSAATWTTLTTTFTTNAACKNGIEIVIGLGACTAGITGAITGVQLELGSQATEFEHRLFGTELALCQRYYSASGATESGIFSYGHSVPFASTISRVRVTFPVTMRLDLPIVTVIGLVGGGGAVIEGRSKDGFVQGNNNPTVAPYFYGWTASAEF